MLVIIYVKNQFHDYIFDGLKEQNKFRKIEIQKIKESILIRALRKILNFLSLSIYFPSLYFKNFFLSEIERINKDDNVFILGNLLFRELQIINKILYTENKKYLWYWNPLKKEFNNSSSNHLKKIIEKQKSLGFTIETFDKCDSKFYHIGLRNQFYRYPVLTKNGHDITYDFYFVGYAKDREEEILTLKNQLSLFNFIAEFKIVKTIYDEIPYLNIIESILRTKCIIDINQKGQTGLTLRPLEAMFFNKKLLTNNRNIMNFDFYHPNNIFILGLDDINNLKKFMGKKNIKLSNEIISKYEINNWMEKYL